MLELFMKLDGLKKVNSIKKLQKYNLPTPETIFIFNFKKQEKEIDDFLKRKKIISIRSDKVKKSTFCPNFPRCPKNKVKIFAKKNKQRKIRRYFTRIPSRKQRKDSCWAHFDA